MPAILPRILPRASAALLLVFAFAGAHADKHYDPGATDTTIKIGNIASYTGVGESYRQVAHAEAAYFKMVDDRGGIHGRRIDFVTIDDGGSIDRGVAAAKKLVEDDKVLLLFGIAGGELNLALRDDLNQRKVPQLFGQGTLDGMADPLHYPWTMGFFPPYRTEGRAYGRYLLAARPDGRIAILHADDEGGREFADGLREGLGAAAATMIVKEVAFAPPEARIAEHVGELKASGATVFANLTFGRWATTAIAAAYDADWHPLQLIPNGALSIHAFLEPAGLQKAKGLISNARSKGWLRPDAARDPEVAAYLDFLRQYLPEASLRDQNIVAGYERAAALVAVLERCGDDLTRANVMKQAASLDLALPMLSPGIRVTTSATDYQPIKQLFLVRFDGENWKATGQVAAP